MHHHLEIIMPPTDDVKIAVEKVMHQFDENASEDDYDVSPKHAFWDWYEIGGRWGGEKLLSSIGEDRVNEFRDALYERKITISNVRCGKPTLYPANQVTLVDLIWNEFFPDSPVKTCPLFDNYHGDECDVMTLLYTPRSMECERVIIAGPDCEGDGLETKHMVSDSICNGVNHQKTTWDGTLGGALHEYLDNLKHYAKDYAALITPTDEWITVTVDYHS